MAAVGLCHTDDHDVPPGSSPPLRLPLAGGHEGAGVVVGVGPHTPGWAEGDHVVLTFIAVCGRCRMCSTGRQNLCDLGARNFSGARRDDPTSSRMSYGARPGGHPSGLARLRVHTLAAPRAAARSRPLLPIPA